MRAAAGAMAVLVVLAAGCSSGSGHSGSSTRAAGSSAPAPTAGPVVAGTPTAAAGPTPTDPPGTPSTGPDGVQHLVVGSVADQFTPQLVRVHTGTVSITLTDSDPEVHDLVIPNAGPRGTTATTGPVRPLGSGTVTAVFPKPGRYDFYCSYHQLDGMLGTFVVS